MICRDWFPAPQMSAAAAARRTTDWRPDLALIRNLTEALERPTTDARILAQELAQSSELLDLAHRRLVELRRDLDAANRNLTMAHLAPHWRVKAGRRVVSASAVGGGGASHDAHLPTTAAAVTRLTIIREPAGTPLRPDLRTAGRAGLRDESRRLLRLATVGRAAAGLEAVGPDGEAEPQEVVMQRLASQAGDALD